MRLALKIAYDGTMYHGYARQPGAITIEGEIMKKLLAMGAIENERDAHFQVASRTDKGVSAAGNIIAFNTDMEAGSVANALAHSVKGIWVAGFTEMPYNFNPRYVRSKTYRYYLYNDNFNIDAIRNAVELFVGEHDFTNFAKLDGRNPVRRIDRAKVSVGKILKIDFEGKSFLWNQIRRMVAAVEKAGKEEISVKDIEAVLERKCKKNFGVAPPENLLLVKIEYSKKLDFCHASKTKPFISDVLKRCEINTKIFEDIERFFSLSK